MCGFAGFFDSSSRASAADMEAVASRMAARLQHRGPDDAGAWTDAHAGVAFGFRRLSIVDLSPQGHQPMRSSSGRYVIALNGEIYNHRALRAELERAPQPPKFRGHSDTEVLLAAIDRWGLDGALQRCAGMFAFALWDCEKRKLHLVRDRLGERPLYYGRMGCALLFGSELKALQEHPAWCGEIDRDVLTLLLRFNYIPGPFSIFKNIQKLPPGAIVSIDRSAELPAPIEYWSAHRAVTAGVTNRFPHGEAEAAERLEALLREVIREEMVADVPVGALLSGGIDSSTIVALMQAESPRPVKTFTIGFDDNRFNEATHAKEVARHLGTDHTEHYLTPEDALAVIPRLPMLYDEPFADLSQIPMLLLAAIARRNVTVCLSGDGGDEVFGGYHRYFYGRRIWTGACWIPLGARRAASRLVQKFAPGSRSGQKLAKLAELLDADDPHALYLRFLSHWRAPAELVPGAVEPATLLTNGRGPKLGDFIEEMMFADLAGYLPDDILVKVDRASMGVSLEVRVPFLDHRVVEFAATLPMSMKVGSRQGKRLLRKVLDKYAPRDLVERPKWGFAPPLALWLRGALRPWAEELLDEKRLRTQGILNPAPISARWREHLAGRRDWNSSLWGVLMFQAWLDQNHCGN
jgi:asparagine synthase (glutamine-hydrolysing)